MAALEAALDRTNVDRQFLQSIVMPLFQTEIMHDGPIFALSDIHGDIHSFIVSLRDCAKVIRKAKGIELDPNIVDPDIERNLNIDISDGINDGNGYDSLLGYEWCGGNSYVVICGDIIDPYRSDKIYCSKYPCPSNGLPCNCIYYPQLEIKLLLFINALNRQAKTNKGRIIKLLGNHETNNILSSKNSETYIYNRMYTFEYDRGLKNYYLGFTRLNIFNICNIGYNLLFEDGCGLLIKINNTIFVHGQLLQMKEYNLININNANQDINNLTVDNTKKMMIFHLSLSTILEQRNWGNEETYDKYIRGSSVDLYNEQIKSTIRSFLSISEDEDISKYRVVIGHCVQFYASAFNLYNTTFVNKYSADSISKTYNAKNPSTHKPNYKDQNTIFGITMASPKPTVNGLTDFYLYRIDIGSSRGFDNGDDIILYKLPDMPESAIETENKLYFSKTPQLLAIHKDTDNNDVITIIKSKMWNTRKQLPRPKYEDLITQTRPGRREDLMSLNDRKNYDKKYLKYKKKYLNLKKIIKN